MLFSWICLSLHILFSDKFLTKIQENHIGCLWVLSIFCLVDNSIWSVTLGGRTIFFLWIRWSFCVFEKMGGCVSTSNRSTCSSRSNGERVSPECLGISMFSRKRIRKTFSDPVTTLQHLSSIPNRIFKNGKSRTSCIFTQQGRKGINQDAMVVWEVSTAHLSRTKLLWLSKIVAVPRGGSTWRLPGSRVLIDLEKYCVSI